MIKMYSALHGMYKSLLGYVISWSQQLMTNTIGEEKAETVKRLGDSSGHLSHDHSCDNSDGKYRWDSRI